jgi:hypothetical protein
VILRGVADDDVAAAKSMLLRFSGERIVESNGYGDILERSPDGARVYINGVLASEEPNFMFSYNITSLTSAMRKKLNRERLSVGRSTYTDRIVAILKQAASDEVRDALVDQTFKAKGDQCDEMQWVDVAQLALNLLSQKEDVTFVTETQLQSHPDIVDSMRRDGYQVVVIGEAQEDRLEHQVESGGPLVRTFGTYVTEYNESFQYRFVEPEQLTGAEQRVLALTPALLRLVGLDGASTPQVRISETIRVTLDNTGGVWDTDLRAIVIRRDQLRTPASYAATLLHEAGHAASGTVDATRAFEQVLTRYLGQTGSAALKA